MIAYTNELLSYIQIRPFLDFSKTKSIVTPLISNLSIFFHYYNYNEIDYFLN
jgi:hypothetical protein